MFGRLVISVTAAATFSLAMVSHLGAQVLSAPSTQVKDFSLPTGDGGEVSLFADVEADFHVVCFLGTECPLARVYGPRLQRMADEFATRGVRWIGVNSNVQDSMEELAEYVRQHGIRFPVAKDYDRGVAVNFGATRTPEVFVIDRGGNIRYQGRIDNQYQPGIARSEANQHDLRNAVEELLAGKPVSRPNVAAVGCLISLPRKQSASDSPVADVTFCNQVIRVLQKHCVECHRDGEIGPFTLDDYDEVVGWADMSLEVIDQGRMPPWHASADVGKFANARHMSEADKRVLRQWVEAGTPYGRAEDLPPPPRYVEGWRLREPPHAVYAMSDRAFEIPAEGTVEYQYFVVDPGFKQDKWISGAEVIPGNRSVVHHCIAFTRPPDGSDIRDIGMLAAYVPGQHSANLPAGYARRVPAGSKIVFQMHYTPTGKPERDVTKLGLVFTAAEQVTHEVFAIGGIEHEFEIPPHAGNHVVAGDVGWFPKEGELLSITPHMHLRGKSFQMSAETEQGETKLIEVPQYDFNWQHNYELSDPLPLKEVKALKFAATFDNSESNPTNPDPTEYVTWGDQTWQEMAVLFLGVARPIKKEANKPSEPSEEEIAKALELEAKIRRQAEAFADQYIKRHDKNGDGAVTSHELPKAVRRFGYLDHNNDDHVSRDELISEAFWRFYESHSE
ncbi:MAG: redoxin domain-containing protein [Pirellulales bacterium]|nr:redoxin domain-containing protein [Pirellulales bacterium]